jgi:hypothetical protein
VWLWQQLVLTSFAWKWDFYWNCWNYRLTTTVWVWQQLIINNFEEKWEFSWKMWNFRLTTTKVVWQHVRLAVWVRKLSLTTTENDEKHVNLNVLRVFQENMTVFPLNEFDNNYIWLKTCIIVNFQHIFRKRAILLVTGIDNNWISFKTCPIPIL